MALRLRSREPSGGPGRGPGWGDGVGASDGGGDAARSVRGRRGEGTALGEGGGGVLDAGRRPPFVCAGGAPLSSCSEEGCALPPLDAHHAGPPSRGRRSGRRGHLPSVATATVP